MDLERIPPGTILTKRKTGWTIRLCTAQLDFIPVVARGSSLKLTLAVFESRVNRRLHANQN